MQQPLRRVGFPLGCLLALLASVPAHAQDQGANAAAPAKLAIGAVDFVKVFEAYPKYIQELKRLEEAKKVVTGKLDEMKNQLNERKSQRELLNPNTRERAQADLELDLAVKQYNGMVQIWGEDLAQQHDRLRVECYEDIERAIEKLAKERHLALVLRLHRFVGEGSVQEKGQAYERRMVWYAADEVDLTADVIKLMQVAGGEPKKDASPAPAKDNPSPAAGKE